MIHKARGIWSEYSLKRATQSPEVAQLEHQLTAFYKDPGSRKNRESTHVKGKIGANVPALDIKYSVEVIEQLNA